LAEITRDGSQMPLGGLVEREVAQMVEQRSTQTPSAAFVTDLRRATTGNPLFVDGVLRVLIAEGKLRTTERLDLSDFRFPEGVRGAIHKRLAMLSTPARELVKVAAAIGPEFDQAVLQRVSRVSAR
jgi:predicted ATPase